jgi:hypothetical protein
MDHRKLTEKEISSLAKQGCTAENWNTVTVRDGFAPKRVCNVHFSGQVKLGKFQDAVETENGVTKSSGLYNAYIQDCNIGDNVYISAVQTIAGYDIESNVVIENTGSLTVTGESTFGNGTEINVINEAGGRELPIFDGLSSQVAYTATGIIGTGTRIAHTGVIRNVNLKGHTVIEGSLHLENGTIRGCPEDPVFVGADVSARDFIILSGSKVDEGAILDKCFVGQGVKIGKQFSAENSSFFANCEGFHGEACSIFAGPYTVTHHKSTLLIAAIYSFYNAGSGTNQSNHMYKLGPVHQGCMERGSKTGSFSYMLWPSRIGPFTAVIGKHYNNFDASELPFSYITEENGKTVITPAMNLITVGTKRDSAKWPTRDRRKDPHKLDFIHFDLFSPYVMQKVRRGSLILRELFEKTPKKKNSINYKGVIIDRLLLRACSKYYELALSVFIGEEVMKRIEQAPDISSLEQIQKALAPSSSIGKGDWADISGLMAPVSVIDDLLANIKEGKIPDFTALEKRLKDIYDNYSTWTWTWCASLIDERMSIKIESISSDVLTGIIKSWEENSIKLNNLILRDAHKEFDPNSKIGFGMGGDRETADKDFTAVRGTYEDNSFVKELEDESKAVAERAAKILKALESV